MLEDDVGETCFYERLYKLIEYSESITGCTRMKSGFLEDLAKRFCLLNFLNLLENLFTIAYS